MFQLWSDNVNIATRDTLEDAERDASYMSKLWNCSIGIWFLDNEGDWFIKLINVA